MFFSIIILEQIKKGLIILSNELVKISILSFISFFLFFISLNFATVPTFAAVTVIPIINDNRPDDFLSNQLPEDKQNIKFAEIKKALNLTLNKKGQGKCKLSVFNDDDRDARIVYQLADFNGVSHTYSTAKQKYSSINIPVESSKDILINFNNKKSDFNSIMKYIWVKTYKKHQLEIML